MTAADLSAAIQAAMEAEGCEMRQGHAGIPTPDIWLECATHGGVASLDGETCSLVARIVRAAAPAVLREHGSQPWQPSDGDTRCQECGHGYVAWFTDSDLWNLVMGGPHCASDPGGCLCSTCFTLRAETVLERPVWHMILELPSTEGDQP